MTPAESLPDDRPDRTLRVPALVGVFNPMARRLVHAGLMGPNVLLTVRGRKSGVPRTTPVALVKIGGRRWIIGTFGPVDWVRNLRAARHATITTKGQAEEVDAIELSPAEGADFFRSVLTPYVDRLVIGRLLLRLLGATDILADPQGAAERRPVFELRPTA